MFGIDIQAIVAGALEKVGTQALVGAVVFLVGAIGVWLLPWIGRAARGDRFAVLVCDLKGDSKERVHKGDLMDALREEFRGEIQALSLRRQLKLNIDDLDSSARAVTREAQNWLLRKRADVLVWGSVIGDRKVLKLHFTARGDASAAGNAKPFKYDEQWEVPYEFKKELSQAIGAAAANAASVAQPLRVSQDMIQRRLKHLDTIAARLRPLIDNPGQAATLARTNIYYAFGLVMRELGLQRDDDVALEAAERAFRLVTSNANPDDKLRLGWSHYQLGDIALLRGRKLPNTRHAAWEEFGAAVAAFTREATPYEHAHALLQRGAVAADIELNRLDSVAEDRNWLSLASDDYLGALGLVVGLAAQCDERRAASKDLALKKQYLAYAQQLRIWEQLIRSSLGRVRTKIGERTLNPQAVAQGERECAAAVKAIDRNIAPAYWAFAQANWGSTLITIGFNAQTADPLRHAVDALRGALAVQRSYGAPVDVVSTEFSLLEALAELARREAGVARSNEAIEAISAVIARLDERKSPLDFIWLFRLRGSALTGRAERSGSFADFDEACRDYERAIALLEPFLPPPAPESDGSAHQQTSPLLAQSAALLSSLGSTLMWRAEFRSRDKPAEIAKSEADFKAALAAKRDAETAYDPAIVPVDWAASQTGISAAEWMLGELYHQTGRDPEALEHFQTAAQAAQGAADIFGGPITLNGAVAAMNLSISLMRLGELNRNPALLEQARMLMVGADDFYRNSEAPLEKAAISENWALLEEAQFRLSGAASHRAAALGYYKKSEALYDAAGATFYKQRIRRMGNAFKAAA